MTRIVGIAQESIKTSKGSGYFTEKYPQRHLTLHEVCFKSSALSGIRKRE